MRKNKRLFGIVLTAVLMLGLFPIKAAQASVGAGEIVFTLTPNGAVTVYSFTDVDIGSTYVGYSVVNISHPSELVLNYNDAALSPTNKPANWAVTIPSGTGGTTNITIMISNPTENGMDTNIENFLNASNFTLRTDGVYPPAGSAVTIMISEQTIVKFTDENGRIHVYEFVEFAKQTDTRILTWLEAYNAARGRSFAGRQGYLATLTSIEEQMFVYNTIAQKPGWLGGTRMRHNSAGNPKIDGSTDISTNINDFISDRNIANVWYWADGPEAGTVFYNTPVRNDTSGPIPGVFNFFSNGWTYNAYPQYRSYIQNGSEPNGDGGECCLQFAWSDKASWNDLVNNSTSVRGFYVEYDFPDGLPTASGVETAIIPVPITVSFDVGNEFFLGTIACQTMLTDGAAIMPSFLETDRLYTNFGNRKFLGWFESLADTTPFDFSTPITALNTQDNAKTLYGKWEQYYNVVFANTRGNIATAQGLPSGGFAIVPDTFAWSDESFTFYGWSADITDDYRGFTSFDFNMPIYTDTIVYGIWDPVIYSLIFNPNGGSWNGDVMPQIREYCPGATDPPWDSYDISHMPVEPLRFEHIFNGWLDGNNMPPPDEGIDIFMSNIYYAQWIPEKADPPPEEPQPEEPTPEEPPPVEPPKIDPPLEELPEEPPPAELPPEDPPPIDLPPVDLPQANLPEMDYESDYRQPENPTHINPPSENQSPEAPSQVDTTSIDQLLADSQQLEQEQAESMQSDSYEVELPPGETQGAAHPATEDSPRTGDEGFKSIIIIIIGGFLIGAGVIIILLRKRVQGIR